MDYREQTIRTVKILNKYLNANNLNEKNNYIHDLITETCNLFYEAEKTQLNYNDFSFLYNLSARIGIPQYYDLLIEKKKIKNENFVLKKDIDYSLSNFMSLINNSTLTIYEELSFHRYQKEIYDSFEKNKLNRYFLTAPTSFGKTFVAYEIIKKMKYKNIVLIFPTIALISENYLKILKEKDDFWNEYEITTIIDENWKPKAKQIWICTPERFVSFFEKNGNQQFDFIFMDEIYKIDNTYFSEEDEKNNTEEDLGRDVIFRIALHHTCENAKDILLAGPYIHFSDNDIMSKSLDNFINDNNFKIINFNNIEIVNKIVKDIEDKKEYDIDGIKFKIKNKDNQKKLEALVSALLKEKENGIIIYCKSKSNTLSTAKKMIKNLNFSFEKSENLSVFIKHLKKAFTEKWTLIKALNSGIGIHNSLIPKYIQKEIISLFNEGELKILVSTTTITEGINTTAKNIIITSNEKGKSKLRHFDAQNISGRAGRFNSHFVGRVFSLEKNFISLLNKKGQILQHKSYDKNQTKNEIDLEIAKEEFLNEEDKKEKERIKEIVKNSGIPEHILNQYKTIKKIDKIGIYNKIKELGDNEIIELEKLSVKLQNNKDIEYEGFEIMCKILYDFVKENKIKNMITKQKNKSLYLTNIVHFYLTTGFIGLINYAINKREENKSEDNKIKDVCEIVFNDLKYKIAKYIGVFDLLYKYHMSTIKNVAFDEIKGFNVLLQMLEYGSTNDKIKKIIDYGVPYEIINYLENNKNNENQFDDYEKGIFKKVKEIFDKK